MASNLLSRFFIRTKIGFFPFILSFIPSIFFKFATLDKNRIIFISSFSNKYNFNSKYLFEYFLKYHKEFDIKFIINDDELRASLKYTYGDYFITNKRFSDIIYILRAKSWILSSPDIPINSIFLNKKRFVFNLGHGIPLKAIGFNESDISFFQKLNRWFRFRQFTHYTAFSTDLENVMNMSFQTNNSLPVFLGQPRNDSLNHASYRDLKNQFNIISNNPKLILYCPTWRPYSDVEFFPFDDLTTISLGSFLEDNDIYIFIRPHPYYPYKINPDFLNLERVIFFDSEIHNDIMTVMNQFDLLITDYSSIYLDYLTLNKPVVFVPYDLTLYMSEVGFGIDYDYFTPGPKVYSWLSLSQAIIKESESSSFSSEIEELNKVTNSKLDNNCSENANFIINYINQVEA